MKKILLSLLLFSMISPFGNSCVPVVDWNSPIENMVEDLDIKLKSQPGNVELQKLKRLADQASAIEGVLMSGNVGSVANAGEIAALGNKCVWDCIAVVMDSSSDSKKRAASVMVIDAFAAAAQKGARQLESDRNLNLTDEEDEELGAHIEALENVDTHEQMNSLDPNVVIEKQFLPAANFVAWLQKISERLDDGKWSTKKKILVGTLVTVATVGVVCTVVATGNYMGWWDYPIVETVSGWWTSASSVVAGWWQRASDWWYGTGDASGCPGGPDCPLVPGDGGAGTDSAGSVGESLSHKVVAQTDFAGPGAASASSVGEPLSHEVVAQTGFAGGATNTSTTGPASASSCMQDGGQPVATETGSGTGAEVDAGSGTGGE